MLCLVFKQLWVISVHILLALLRCFFYAASIPLNFNERNQYVPQISYSLWLKSILESFRWSCLAVVAILINSSPAAASHLVNASSASTHKMHHEHLLIYPIAPSDTIQLQLFQLIMKGLIYLGASFPFFLKRLTPFIGETFSIAKSPTLNSKGLRLLSV